MEKLFAFAALVAVVITLVGPSAFAEGKRVYQIRGVTEKASSNTQTSCNAVYVGDVPRGGETLAAFVAPKGCLGTSFVGPVRELRLKVERNGLTYYLFTKAEPFAAPLIGSANLGDEVQVLSDRPVEFTLGNVTISAYPTAVGDAPALTFITANVGGMVFESVASETACTAAGCIEQSRYYIHGMFLLDRSVEVDPGTAVLKDKKLVGFLMAPSAKGLMLVMSAATAAGTLCDLSDVPQFCKG